MTSPIFIVGANRSGTTLLRLILNAHVRIGIPDELIYFDTHLAGVPIERWRSPGLSEERYAAFVRRFLDGNAPAVHVLDRPALEQKILAGARDFRRPYRLLLRTWADRYGKARWGEKTPGNLFYADVIHDMFPQARFIHVVRDPRAVVHSMGKVDFFSNDVAFNALAWRKHVTAGRAVLERSVPAAQRITVRYEDLVSAPEEAVRTVCTFLEEDYAPAMLRFHEDAGRYMKKEAASDFNRAATRPISTSGLQKWKRRLDPETVAVIESLCGAEMRAFGYEPAGRGMSPSRRLKTTVRRAYWQLQAWRNRGVRHYTVKSPVFARSRRRLRQLAQRA